MPNFADAFGKERRRPPAGGPDDGRGEEPRKVFFKKTLEKFGGFENNA